MFNRKRMYLILVFVVFSILITSCSSTDGSEKIAVDKTDVEVDVSNVDSQEDEQSKKDAAEQVVVEEQVLLDQDDIKITLKSLEFDGMFGPSLKVLVENNSEEPITVQTRDSSINDVMIESMFSCDVVSGKKANDSITFMESDLEHAGIKIIKDIEFKFHIFNSDTWDGVLDSDTITINTSADLEYVQEYDDSGVIVLDEKDIKIVMKKVSSEDSFWGADVHVYIENNSDNDITIQARDVSINGFMLEPIFSSDVIADKKAYDTITFFESDLIDNEITSIEKMELSFHIFESNGWDTILDTPMIDVSFE